MISLSRDEGLKVWERFWDEATFEFFKVEDIQDYADEHNDQKGSLSLWLKGKKEASIRFIQNHKNAWADQTSSKNISKIRIHVVDEPYSEYLKWEIEHYKIVNIPLGKENVYLVNRKDVPGYNQGDFMMFDQKRVTKSNYSTKGVLTGMDIYENEPIEQFRKAKELLLKYAVEIIV
jgi:hypothetical protein